MLAKVRGGLGFVPLKLKLPLYHKQEPMRSLLR
jgi:hypothetical protein